MGAVVPGITRARRVRVRGFSVACYYRGIPEVTATITKGRPDIGR